MVIKHLSTVLHESNYNLSLIVGISKEAMMRTLRTLERQRLVARFGKGPSMRWTLPNPDGESEPAVQVAYLPHRIDGRLTRYGAMKAKRSALAHRLARLDAEILFFEENNGVYGQAKPHRNSRRKRRDARLNVEPTMEDGVKSYEA